MSPKYKIVPRILQNVRIMVVLKHVTVMITVVGQNVFQIFLQTSFSRLCWRTTPSFRSVCSWPSFGSSRTKKFRKRKTKHSTRLQPSSRFRTNKSQCINLIAIQSSFSINPCLISFHYLSSNSICLSSNNIYLSSSSIFLFTGTW